MNDIVELNDMIWFLSVPSGSNSINKVGLGFLGLFGRGSLIEKTCKLSFERN